MKWPFIFLATILVTVTGFAQTDSSRGKTDSTPGKTDTIKVGNFIIVKKNKNTNEENVKKGHTITIEIGPEANPFKKKMKKPSNISTDWWIMILGFALGVLLKA